MARTMEDAPFECVIDIKRTEFIVVKFLADSTSNKQFIGNCFGTFTLPEICDVEIRLHLMMLIWLCISFVPKICGQTIFKKTGQNEILDVSFENLIVGADPSSFSNSDPENTSRFGMIRNEPDDGVLGNLKKSDGINNQVVFGKQSFESNMMPVPLSEKMAKNLAPPVLNESLVIAAGKTTGEMVQEFKDEKTKSVNAGISRLNNNIQNVADEEVVEKLVRDSNLSERHNENSLDFPTLGAPISNPKKTDDPTLNTLDYTTVNLPNASIIWSNPQVFIQPVHITKFHSGHEILSVNAHEQFNSSIEFMCTLPAVVFCVTDLLSNDNYRLRIVYTGNTSITNFNLPLIIRTRSRGKNSYTSWNTSIQFIADDKIQLEVPSITTEQSTGYKAEAVTDEFHMQSNVTTSEKQLVSLRNGFTIHHEKATKAPPTFIFTPHFEHNNYVIYVPEGKNKDSMIVAVVYFLTYSGDVEVKFLIQSEPLQWFYLGEVEKETNANRLIVALNLMLHGGTDIDFRKTNNGHYKFQIKAIQGSFETATDVNVEVLTFATKGTSYSSAIPTTSETLLMAKFTTNTAAARGSWSSTTRQTRPAASTWEEADQTFAKKLASAREVGTTKFAVKFHDQFSSVTTPRSIQYVEELLSFPEGHAHENFAETLQSTVYDNEATTNTVESTTEKVAATPVTEIAKHQLQSAFRANPSSINVPLFGEPSVQLSRKASGNWQNFSLKGILNKKQGTDGFQPLQEHEINSDSVTTSPERGTSTTAEIRRNALTTEAGMNSKNNEFDENNDNFSSHNQEELPIDNKLATTVVSSVQNTNSLFPNIPVEDGKSLQDKFNTPFISTTTPVSNIGNMHWSFQNSSDESFEDFAPKFKTNMDKLSNNATATESTNLRTEESSTSKGIDSNVFSYTDDLITSAWDSHYTSSYTGGVTWKNNKNNIDTIVTLRDTAKTTEIDRESADPAIQSPLVSLTENMHAKDYKMNESLDELQQADSNRKISAVLFHPKTVSIEAEAKGEQSGDNSVKNGFKMNKMQSREIMIDVKLKTIEGGKYVLPNEFRDSDILPDLDIVVTASNIDPYDAILISINSSALEVIPPRMQPGKTVFLAVRDAEKLDRDLLDGSLFVKVTASQQTRPSVTSSKVVNIVIDESLTNKAPSFLLPEYDFHVNEGSVTGQKVGQIDAEFTNRGGHGIITYELIGPGSELFAVNGGGTVSVACPSVQPCLDREQTIAYHLLAVFTDRNGLKSVPAIVKIFIDDRNDNGPILETSQNEITVSNGRLTKPFVLKVKDNDVAPHNAHEISVDGTASSFISLEKIRDNIYYGRLWSLPAAGIYQLIITARDSDVNIPEQRITVNTRVLNTVTKAHFKRSKYETTANTEALFKGNSILQPEVENAPPNALRFILSRNDPGWLSVDQYSGTVIVGNVPRTGIVSGQYSTSIAAVNRTDGMLITECVLVLNVSNDNHMRKLFTKKLIIRTLRRDSTVSRQTVEILSEHNEASVTIMRESISAVDEQLHHAYIDKNAISVSNNMIIMDMEQLQQTRMLQFNLSAKEDASDSAKVILFLSSEPVEMAHERKRQARPRFSHPWRSGMNIILIKLAENSPEGYTIISLSAYNPMNGTKIMDLRLSGEMAQHFAVDGRSGDVQVVTPFDFEAMEPESHVFDLLLIAGEEPYETAAVLRVEIIDVDDNPPKIAKLGDYNLDNLMIAENSRPGTVLFEVQISDPDYMYGKRGAYNYTLSGNGAANFQIKKMNDTVAVIVSPTADLDREKVDEMVILLKVSDDGGNSDSVVAFVTLIDVNDNVPAFIHNEYKVEAVENWPEAMVLTCVHAKDKDKGRNADIRYSLSPTNEYFEIDPISGWIRARKALVGLARAYPYDFSVLASDQGIPSLSSSATVSIHVLESTSLSQAGGNKGIHIVSPSVHFTLQLNENTPANYRIYSVRAKIGGFNEQFGREIKYSITPVDNETDGGWFTMDTSSGDLLTLRKLDHEVQPAITCRKSGK
ncbi:unnamed protein product [Litomosoides sigmodontis]|uniref:Cadherin domain-containing protein n=1 Tax=Litomosoides sigmodontis TaxID=42156 RepID=A0A3P6T8Z3_LITSI|nr:unnamed protein product [Litomosoides sigmodontis]